MREILHTIPALAKQVLLVVAPVALLAAPIAYATPFYLVPLQAAPGYDANTVPFPYDANTVQGELLGTVTHRAGKAGSITGTYSDPDGDPVTIRLSSVPSTMTMSQDPNASKYTLTWTPTAQGIYPVVVTATDQPPTGDGMTATGTILWNVLPENRSPFLAPVGNLTVNAAN